MSPVTTIAYLVSRFLNKIAKPMSSYLTLFYIYNLPNVLRESVTIEVLSEHQTLITKEVI